MKKFVTVALSLTALAFSSLALADTKVGVVNVREVLQKAPQMSAASAELQKQFKPREAKIAAAQKELQAKVEKLNREASVMSESDRAKLQDKIISEKAALAGMIASFQQDLSNAQNKSMQNVMGQVNAVITKIGNEGKYTYIVVRDATAYFDKSLDITPQVIQALGKK